MELPMAPSGKKSPHQSHDHDHGNVHHSHSHGHDPMEYYEQYLGIAVSGIMGLVSLYLFQSGKLNVILAPKFHIWVLISGFGLILLSLIRGYLAITGVATGCCSHDHGEEFGHENGAHSHGSHSHGENGCCGGAHHHHHHHHHHENHEHVHGNFGQSQGTDEKKECCNPEHDHSHHDHTHVGHTHHHHDHGHDHSHGSGFLPVQTMILLSPIVLLLGLPTEVFNASQAVDASQVEASSRDIKDKGEDFGVTFTMLEKASATEETRSFYEGKIVRLNGRFVGDDDKRFTLIRYKINCCAADAVPLNSVIMVDPKSSEKLPLQKLRNQWVQVTGKVQFLKKLGKEEYVSSLILTPAEGKNLDSLIEIVPQDANPYVN